MAYNNDNISLISKIVCYNEDISGNNSQWYSAFFAKKYNYFYTVYLEIN